MLNFGSEELKAKIVPEVFAAKKFICLAISEAQAGSDVMGLQTTAVKSEDGKHWIINGTYSFCCFVELYLCGPRHEEMDHECNVRSRFVMTFQDLTFNSFADYFTVGCKTEDGFTVILVERGEGVETRPVKTSYSSAAGTAFITFDNVKVPVGNTLGEEGGGIFVILRYAIPCCTVHVIHICHLVTSTTRDG